MSCQDLERDLDAYVDRELDADTAMAYHGHLTACAECRRRVAERDGLGRLVRSAPFYPAPGHLRARLSADARRSNAVRRGLSWAAAAVLMLAVGGSITTWRSTVSRGEALAEQMVDNHVRSLMADHMFDVQSTDQHTVKPWFLGKLDFAPPVVDLAAVGFPLVGGRLDYVDGHPIAALVYQRHKHTINVFVSPAPDDASARTYQRSIRGFHLRQWNRSGMSFWAVSDLNDAELTEFVRALSAS